MGDSSRKAIVSSSANTPISTSQASWDLNIFEDAIKHKSYECSIERALMCPCITKGTNSALSNCQNCGGTGWVHINLSKSYLMCHSISNINKYQIWSEENRGTVQISARHVDRLAFMDRVTLLELEGWYSEVKQLRTSSTAKKFFFLTYQPLEIMDMYIYVDVNSPLLYVDGDKYTTNLNKVVFIDGFIEAFQAANPGVPVTVTVRYAHNPTYYVLDINRDLVRQPTKNACGVPIGCDGNGVEKANYPIRCIGRRAHFVLNQPNFNGDRLFDNTNYDKYLAIGSLLSTEGGNNITTESGKNLNK